MKQQCYLAMIYLNWILLVGGLVFLAYERLFPLAVAWAVLGPLAMWGYIRAFPSISPLMGYGRIEDEPAPITELSHAEVRLYTALGCPFCPIVRERLFKLRERMGFQLEEIDVTLRPGLLAAKGIRAVPTVEAGKHQLVGNITSERLAELVSSSSAA